MSGAMGCRGGRAAAATRVGGSAAPVGPAKATVARAERPARFFRNAAGRLCAAFRLLVADGERGWLGMMRMGATITAEAWNMGVKFVVRRQEKREVQYQME